MAFIRKKNINGISYAYLVNNKWTNKGSRQKAKYLGKVLKPEIVKEAAFADFIMEKYSLSPEEFFRKNKKTDIVDELIKHELMKRGFTYSQTRLDRTGKGNKPKDSVLSNNKYYYKSRKVFKLTTNRETVVEMNEGFMCDYSVEKLLRLKPTGYDEREQGIKLAKALLEAGLKVEKENFIYVFERWVK